MNTQILKDRPFKLEDGFRKVIVCKVNNVEKVFTRQFRDSPIFSPIYSEAKTYKDDKALNNLINNIIIPNKYEYKIFDVLDLFEPRYVVRYVGLSPNQELVCYNSWVLINKVQKGTYTDYYEAQEALAKSKRDLTEFYYQKIMSLRSVELTEIKTGA